jgi:hypothetical protein
VEERLPRRVAQEFEAQAGRSGLGRGSDGSTQVGNPVSEKKKEVLARVLQVQTLFAAQDNTRERKEEEGRRMGGTGLPTSSSSDPSRAPDAHYHRHV